jgi:hypothetical protein
LGAAAVSGAAAGRATVEVMVVELMAAVATTEHLRRLEKPR